jgi:hypothetical protein
MLASLVADAATEGRNVIIGMLVVGCVFLLVIALGEFAHWFAHRHERH